MQVLMVYAHPRAESLSAALRDAAKTALEAAGHQVGCTSSSASARFRLAT